MVEKKKVFIKYKIPKAIDYYVSAGCHRALVDAGPCGNFPSFLFSPNGQRLQIQIAK